MNYDEIVLQLMIHGYIPQNSEDQNFTRLLPLMFHYADGRIYRELNFLVTDVYMPVPVIAQQRDAPLPASVLTVRSVAIIGGGDRRHPLERITPEALDQFWPQPSFKRSLPRKYTIIGTRVPPAPPVTPTIPPSTQPQPLIYFPERFLYTLRLMPTPDRAYTAELFGGVEPELLSRTNPETFLTVYYAELFIACCMVWLTGYQRDYGAAADDPQRAVSWEGQYRVLRDAVASEHNELRGTSLPTPAQAAQQPRAP